MCQYLQTGKGSIYVTVKDNSGKAAAGAEVTVLVVDKAFLDLMPYPLQVILLWTEGSLQLHMDFTYALTVPYLSADPLTTSFGIATPSTQQTTNRCLQI